MSRFKEVIITDEDGHKARVENNGGLAVNLQDQTSEIVDLYLHLIKETLTLSSNTNLDDTEVDVVSVSGVSTGDIICFLENGRYTQCVILAINTLTLTLDSPLDYAYTTSADVHTGEINLAGNGSLGSPILYSIAPPTGVQWDIVRLIFHIEDQTVMDTSKFGGITGLTNGCVLRLSNGVRKNVLNTKSNGEFAERAYDVHYTEKAPAGFYGITIRRTFGGQSKNGVVLRLDGDSGDELIMMIQDNLTGLDHFHCIAQGHAVTD